MPLPAFLDLVSWSVKEHATGFKGLGIWGLLFFLTFVDD